MLVTPSVDYRPATEHMEFEKDRLVCDECGKSFASQSSVSRHKRRRHQEKKHECAQCGKTFGLVESLTEHSISHNDEVRNTCSICGKGYRHRQSLRRHLDVHTEKPKASSAPRKEVQRCTKCGKSFLHLRKHSKICRDGRERNYSCSVCGRRFLEKGYLQEHVRCVHSYEELFPCKKCDEKFNYRASLLNHTRRFH